MRLDIFLVFTECPPWNYGGAASAAAAAPSRVTISFFIAFLALLLAATVSVRAEPATQTGFDPRQAEKHFDDLRSEQSQPPRSTLIMPPLTRPPPQPATNPLLVLRHPSSLKPHP